MNIAEFFIKLGIKTDDQALARMDQNLMSMGKKLGIVTAAAGAALFALDRFVDGTVRGTVALENFNKQTGLSIDQLQKWQVAGKLSDTSLTFEQIAQSVGNLQQRLTDISLGGNIGIEAILLRGVSPLNTDAFEALEAIRENIKGIEDAKVVNLLGRLGLSPNFINILRLSREEFEKLGKQYFLSEKQRKQIVETGTAITKLKIEIGLLKDRLVVAMTPALIRAVDMTRFLADGFMYLVQQVQLASEVWYGYETALKVVASALVGLGAAMFPVAAAVVGLFLLVEDLMSFGEGKDSITGRLVDGFAMLGKEIQTNIIDPMNEMLNRVEKLSGLAGAASALATGGATGVGMKLGERMRTTFNNIFNINSAADADEVAQSIVDKQQSQLNYSLDDTNNGAMG